MIITVYKVMNKLSFKNIELYLDEYGCTVDKSEVCLSKTEYFLLKFFMENPNKVFNRNEIISAVWTKRVSIRSVDSTVLNLRKKLGNSGKYIRTRPGFGYGILDH